MTKVGHWKTNLTNEQRLVDQFRSKLALQTLDVQELKARRLLSLLNESDSLVRRFLSRKDHNVDLAVKQAIKALQFFHEMDIDSIQRNHFPPEFYILAPFVVWGQDRDGNSCFYTRAKFSIPQILMQITVKYTANLLIELGPQLGDASICNVIDCTGVGWSNLAIGNFSIVKFWYQAYRSLPLGLARVIVYNAPKPAYWYYRSVRPFIPRSMRDKLVFVNGDQIQKFISPENLPDFITGTESLTQNYRPKIPINCLDCESSMKYHGVDMKLYTSKLRPWINQMIQSELIAYPNQLGKLRRLIAH